MFAACFRMYKKKGAKLEEIEGVLAKVLGCPAEECWQALEKLLDGILDRSPLESFGMTEQHLADFPPTVLATQQRLLKNMPVQLSEDEVRAIYAECMERK